MKKILIYLLLSLTLTSCSLFRKAQQVNVNKEAEEYLASGLRLLRAESYQDAMDKFDQAIGTEYHKSTTVAIYLTGLSAYYAGLDNVAKSRFSRLKSEYPRSRYIDDANYHIALIQLGDRRINEKQKGIMTMMDLSENASQTRTKRDALAQVQKAFFSTFTLEQLKGLERRVPKNLRTNFKEAEVFKLLQEGKAEEAKKTYETFKLAGGKSSDYLKKMTGENEKESTIEMFEPNIIKLAVALPFYNDEANPFSVRIPGKVKLGLEFYQGFNMAVNEFEANTGKNIYVEVLDTRRDTGMTRALTTRLDRIAPRAVIGAIYNAQSRILSEWAEDRGVPMIIPISPAEELVTDKQYTFLAHPSSRVHGQKMAEYAFNDLGLKHIYMFQDGSTATRSLAEGFANTFTGMGGQVDSLTFITNYTKETVKQISKLVGEVEDDSAGVYIPVMGNEEAAGLIVNILKQKNKELPILGSPHFKSRYKAIPRDIKESYQLIFSTSHLDDPSSKEHTRIKQEYMKEYHYPPSEWVIQGYDMGKYILTQLDKYDPSLGFTVDTYLRGATNFSSLHTDYNFSSQQINQAVNIGQFQPNGVKKLNSQ
ncbi:MAG: ABC transporter substrate-binding protein [Bacteroidota bacterium]